jgi:uncharacterized membrane protein
MAAGFRGDWRHAGKAVKADIEVTAETEIGAPHGAVWAVLADVERLPEFIEEIASAHEVSDGPTGVATIKRESDP